MKELETASLRGGTRGRPAQPRALIVLSDQNDSHVPGSGNGCDTQFLSTISWVIIQSASSCKGTAILAENRRLQEERIAAFSEYIADVKEGRFPERCHLVEMDAQVLDEVVHPSQART
jgi:hypothetical protein